MKKIFTFFKFVILLCLVGAFVAIGYIDYHFYVNPRTQIVDVIEYKNHYVATKTELDFEISEINKVQKQPISEDNIIVGGWIPDWAVPSGFDTLKANPQIRSISPFWFDCLEDGDLNEGRYTNWSEMLTYVEANDIEFNPTVTCFNADVITKVFNNPDNLNKMLDKIMWNVETYDYDGIDLDFEAFYLNDKKIFFNFLTELKRRLNENNKKLVVTFLAKVADSKDYPGYWQTMKVEDYKKAADIADELRLMAYNFSSRGAEQAGAIGPLEWCEAILKYTINLGIPRNKIVLGVHTYAYDWSDRPIMPDRINYYENSTLHSSGGEKGDAFYHSTLDDIKNKYGLEVTYNEVWGEAIGRYNYNGQKRIVVFPNDEFIKARKKLAADYGIKGIYYWKLGGEGTLQL